MQEESLFIRSTVAYSPPRRQLYVPLGCSAEFGSKIVSFTQGQAYQDGALTSIQNDKADPLNALGDRGLPVASPVVSLGFGGEIEFEFNPPLVNALNLKDLLIEGANVFNQSLTCAQDPQKAEVLVSQDGINYTSLGEMCIRGVFEFAALPWVKFVKIIDKSDKNDPLYATGYHDGFQLDYVHGIDCFENKLCPADPIPNANYFPHNHDMSLWLPPINLNYKFLSGDQIFEEYRNGSARLEGTLQLIAAPNNSYYMIASLSGKTTTPPPMSPKLLLNPNAYVSNGGPIDPSTWYYYEVTQGVLIGLANNSGQILPFTGMGPAFQVGTGANGKDLNFGASAWLNYTHPNNNIYQADTQFDLNVCNPTPTATHTPTATSTATNTPTQTATNTPTETATSTATFTPTETVTSTPTNTATETATNTPTNTATETVTSTPSNTPTNTSTNTATNTPTETATNTPTNTATETATNTSTSTYTPTSTATETHTATPSNTVTSNPTSTATETPTNTATETATPVSTAAITSVPSAVPTSSDVQDPPVCDSSDIRGLQFKLDGEANTQRKLVEKALRPFKTANAKKYLKFIQFNSTEAAKLSSANWKNIWGLPSSIQSCSQSNLCTTVSLASEIDAYSANAIELNNLLLSVLQKGRKDKLIGKSFEKRLKTAGSDTLKSSQQSLSQIPRTNTTCR